MDDEGPDVVAADMDRGLAHLNDGQRVPITNVIYRKREVSMWDLDRVRHRRLVLVAGPTAAGDWLAFVVEAELAH